MRHLTKIAHAILTAGMMVSSTALANIPLPIDRAQPPQKSETSPFTQVGDFYAAMFIIAYDDLNEFSSPANQGVKIKVKSTAKVGDVVVAKILFAGMKLNGRGEADVTYDLKIYGPDGKIYSDSVFLNQTALKSAVPNIYYIFNNGPDLVAVRFEPQDLKGKYTLKAVLHDNIGKVDIPLSAEIDLAP